MYAQNTTAHSVKKRQTKTEDKEKKYRKISIEDSEIYCTSSVLA